MLFRSGEAFAAEVEMPFLGSIPLDPAVRTAGDGGEPVVLGEGRVSDAFRDLTGRIADAVGIVHRRSVSPAH